MVEATGDALAQFLVSVAEEAEDAAHSFTSRAPRPN
jgi:hypothetical protein